MRPLFKYFGSKFQLSKRYPKPAHDLIIEPFAGSACYALRHYEHDVILIEKDPFVAGLWSWLIGADPEEILSLPASELVTGQDIRDLHIPMWGKHLIRRWQRTGHTSSWTVSKWCNSNTGFWCEETKRAVAENIQKIRHWKVILGEYDCVPNQEATWFIDPPYQHVKNVYGDKSTLDYEKLSAFCRTRVGQRIVCEQSGADWLDFQPFSKVRTMRAGHGGDSMKRHSTEVIWTR